MLVMGAQQGAGVSSQALVTRRGVVAGLLGAAAGLGACSERIPPQARNLPAEPILPPVLTPPMQSAWPSLDARAQAMISTGQTPGLSISVMCNANWMYSKGFGLADIGRGLKMTPQTEFRIGSVSKQFTAAAIMLLAEERFLKLTDPLALYLPQFPRAADITLTQLLSHTSGLGDYLADVYPIDRRHSYNADELIAAISSSRPLFQSEPGTAWHYSNSGFALLGIVVEKLARMPYRDFCRWRLFAAAGLGDTRIGTPDADPSACVGYSPGFHPTVSIPPSLIGGAGAISSTSQDLCRWHALLMRGQVLQPASFKTMQTPVRFRNGALVAPSYGLGLSLGRFGEARFISHSGLVNGFTAHLRSFPDQRLTVAILSNCDGGGSDAFTATQIALRDEVSRLALSALKPNRQSVS
jgi:CubicO group peptidase (beta-lactamase class C family)